MVETAICLQAIAHQNLLIIIPVLTIHYGQKYELYTQSTE